MTFKHKLSVRLALIRNTATAFAAVAIFGCAGDFAVAPEQPLFDVTAPQILFQESFEDAAFASRAWYDNTAMTTTTAEHIPGSTRALEARFLAGATNPTWGGAARHLFPVTPTLYVSYWVKYSANWVGSARSYHPHELLVLSDQDGDWDGPSNNWLTAYIEHTYQNGGIPRLALQDSKAINTGLGGLPNNLTAVTEGRSVSGCNGVVEPNVVATCFNMPPWYNGKELSASQVWFKPTAGPGYKGDWNHVEVYFQMNSVVGGLGLPDGVMQYWFNGAPVIDRHDILYRTGARPTIQFRQFMIAPYIGDGSPVDQTMWIDDLIVATGKPAAPSPPPPPAAIDTSVTSVTVSPASANVAVGATRQLTATLKDVNGATLTGRAVTWTSSAPAVATVSATGLVRALQTGAATITAASEGKLGTSAITVTAVKPSAVTNLTVASVSSNSVTLSFTEVDDGSGRPASYQVRFKAGTLSWGSGTDVANGTCKVPMSGTAIGATRTCTVAGLTASKAYQFQLSAFRGTLNVNAVFGALSNKVSGTTAANVPVPPVVTNPGTVTNLSVAGVTDTSVTLSFTEVTGGAGLPASYDVRYSAGAMSWGSATPVASGSCRVVMVGTTIGATRSCTVLGLTPGTAYQFEVVAFRGTLNIDAVFGALSNVASGSTTSSLAPPPVQPPPPPPSGGWTHEPTGLTVIQDMNWENGSLGSWFRKFVSSDKPITIVPITDSPIGEGQALQIGFNAGHQGGGGTELEYDIPSALRPREMFVGYYVQVSSNWQGHSSAINKMVYLDDGGSSFSAMWYEMFGSGSSPLGLYVVNQSGGSPSGIHENGAAVNFTRGVWHKVEIYQKQGSPGIIRVWVDGVLAIDRSDVYTKDAAIGMVTISGIWGGIDDVKQHFDYMRFDNIHISGR